MINYIDNRYLDIQLEFNEAAGLKIPVSSISKRNFILVPEEYITNGGDDGSTGVMLKTYDKHGNQHNTFKKMLRFIIKMKKTDVISMPDCFR